VAESSVGGLETAVRAGNVPDVASVLLIEDDQGIREALASDLARSGHDIATAASGIEGVERFASRSWDVVLLDLGLPDIDGADVLRMIRGLGDTPIIITTARDEEREIVRLLDAGADDYVVKPFTTAQIEARIRAVLRRASGDDREPLIVVGDLEVDVEAHEVRLAAEPLDLTGKEFDLLAYLAHRPGVMVSKRELMAEVWHQPYGGADKTVDVHVSWLRKKLGESAAQPRYIHTKRGVGVKLVEP
jgi:DNA-binding response OmpR family regulator